MHYNSKKARAARLRLLGIGVLVGAVVVGGGVLAVTSLGSDDSKADSRAKSSPTHAEKTAKPRPSPSGGAEDNTPETGPKLPLLKPRTSKNGIGVGFEHSSWGAESAAINYRQDMDIIDDVLLRKQLATITSPDSQDSIDERVSEVRTIREEAGLPPSGGAPDRITFSTVVKASRGRSLDDDGEVVEVWMVHDRYGTEQGKGGDSNPLKNQLDCLIVKWQDGDWKLTDEPKYVKLKSSPSAYFPDSKFAFKDGWREVGSE
ncbi:MULTISPECIES: hypothetical protein [Streptomyces]|uniref:hypothetical protein n=1 Tax=Streptomyces TaxID=1883 RepID=UPI001EE69218|nr:MULTISPECIES: hypothetical protein [Streptomyces]